MKALQRLFAKVLLSFFILGLLCLILFYAAGFIPVQYALNLSKQALPAGWQVSGSLANGKLAGAWPQTNVPFWLTWSRKQLAQWSIVWKSEMATGNALVNLSPRTIKVYDVKSHGYIDLQAMLTTASLYGMAHYRADNIEIEIPSKGHPIKLNDGVIDISQVQVVDNGKWQTLGDYHLSAQASLPAESLVEIVSSSDNLFILNGIVNIGYQDNEASYVANIKGHFTNQNNSLLFPWLIPVSGKKTEQGMPVDYTSKLPIN